MEYLTEYMSDHIYSSPIAQHLITLRIAYTCCIVIRQSLQPLAFNRCEPPETIPIVQEIIVWPWVARERRSFLLKNSAFIRSSRKLENFWSFSFAGGQCRTFTLWRINISILTVATRIYITKNVRLSDATSLIVGRQASSFLLRACDLESITEYGGFI